VITGLELTGLELAALQLLLADSFFMAKSQPGIGCDCSKPHASMRSAMVLGRLSVASVGLREQSGFNELTNEI